MTMKFDPAKAKNKTVEVLNQLLMQGNIYKQTRHLKSCRGREPMETKAEYCLNMLIEEANKLRVYQGKPFLSMKDIDKAWFVLADIYPKSVLEDAKKSNKVVFKPKMGIAKVDRIINKYIPQERTGIKFKSMNWSISKRVRILVYRIAKQMEYKDELNDEMKEKGLCCYACGRVLTKGNKSASRFSGHPLCRKCAKFP